MIFVDTHVHIYDRFELGFFFDAAWKNADMARQKLAPFHPTLLLLMLTEGFGMAWFERICRLMESGKNLRGWKIRETGENCSLMLQRKENQVIYLIAGSQIQSAEGLEVLALGTKRRFEDNIAIEHLIDRVNDAGAVAVVPWGFGKWTGRRGRLLDRLLNGHSAKFHLGDNGGRPEWLGTPRPFQAALEKGLKILPGSDPLAFDNESGRAGSYGFYCDENISSEKPAEYIKRRLRDPSFQIVPYGNRTGSSQFIRSQVRIQFNKHFGKSNARHQ
ncbi:MAG: hypothetical protein R6U50_07390 [Desulfobacterales bacterium]